MKGGHTLCGCFTATYRHTFLFGTAPAYTNGMRTMRKGEFHGDSRETRMMGGLTLADAEYRTLVTNYGGELAD